MGNMMTMTTPILSNTNTTKLTLY